MKTKIFNRLTVRLSRLRDGLSLRGHAGTVSALVLFALSWASCDRSQEDGLCAPSGELCRVPITLKTGLDTEISVKSVADHDDNLVANVWVVQLTEDGTSQLAAPQYVESMQKIGDGYRFTMDLPQRPMKLVFLANTGDPSLLPDTGNSLESLSSLGCAVTDESSLYIDGLAPRSGVWTGTPNALGLTSTVELVRSCATVALNLQASLSEGYEFQLKSVSVKNVPAKSYYLAQAERETLFPSTSEGKVADYAEESFPTLVPFGPVSLESSPQQLEWVIPANLRGKGTATKAEEKSAATAPDGQADYCTYIEIKGTYGRNIGGQTGALNAECTYRLYLGENLTDDYNVKPGYKYNLDATIKGANVLDARITVDESSYGLLDSRDIINYTDGACARWPFIRLYALSDSSTFSRLYPYCLAAYLYGKHDNYRCGWTPIDNILTPLRSDSIHFELQGYSMTASSGTIRVALLSTEFAYLAPHLSVGPLNFETGILPASATLLTRTTGAITVYPYALALMAVNGKTLATYATDADIAATKNDITASCFGPCQGVPNWY